ncbi:MULTISPECIES: putative amidoligase domain-containing protein [Bacillaceae]|uniref:Uncharacterized protein n=1 Tax=Evansella alkalicola TaxID=745819 RepID=A0ABS6JVQ4_9BACI|nr:MULTISPECIES: hypothetical protein [Bacillaceae]MBU9722663.1 hypothetical protein [Bacillus alkalicola]
MVAKKNYELHGIRSMEEKDNGFQMIVEGTDFYPISIQVKQPLSNNYITIQSHASSINKYYLGQEMMDTAIMAAYYNNLPSYRVQVQRMGKEIGVISTEENEHNLSDRGEGETQLKALLGADIEVMVYHPLRGSFVAIPMGNREGSKIGSDRALIRKGHAFYQPIIELRPSPQESGIKLRDELHTLKCRLEENLGKRSLQIVSSPNPTGRFYLGGHIHVSNQKATFRKASQLDALITLPLSAYYMKNGLDRRKIYGRLGSIRLNPYNGFEYRTLPSWYELIDDDNKVFFQWIEFIFLHPNLPHYKFTESVLRAYYHGDIATLKIAVTQFFQQLYPLLSSTEQKLINEWLNWLKMRERID